VEAIRHLVASNLEAMRVGRTGGAPSLYDMIDEVFGPEIIASPRYRLVADLSVQLISRTVVQRVAIAPPKSTNPDRSQGGRRAADPR
jgi:hypothetical protein